MSTPRALGDFLRDMLDNAEKAQRFAQGLSFEQFRSQEEKIYAVVRAGNHWRSGATHSF